jgi:hypothetical protein
MATATPTPRTAERPLPPASVRHPLERLRGTLRTYVGLEGAAAALIYLALWFWVGLLLDFGVFKAFALDWVQELPWGFRAFLLAALVLGLAALVAVQVVRRLLVEFSPAALALVLERRFPKVLGDRLITAVELADLDRAAEQGYSRAMIEQTVRDAAERVGQVPVNDVFDWGRLRRLGGWVLGLSLGLFLLAGVAYSAATRTNPFTDFAVRFKDVAAIWFERNVLLANTIWPRQAHLELLDFPEAGDLRVGRDAPSPRLRVRAWKWVAADPAAAEGWRLMTWGDLTPQLVGGPVPDLPTDLLAAPSTGGAAAAAAAVAGPAAGAAAAFTAPAAATAAADRPAPPAADWTLDRVNLLLDAPDVRARINDALSPDRYLALAGLFETLAARAAEPGMGRKFRRLDVPDRVDVSYWGAKTSNEMPLARGNDQEYAGALGDLKESVRFRVRARDYAMRTRTITLVPPPMLTQLSRDEARPAYLYHRPPLGTPPQGGLPALKGLKQQFKDLGVSLTGPTSQFSVPAGTDVDLTGLVDKDLTRATLIPRTRVGADAGGAPLPLTLTEDARGFRHRFADLTAVQDFEIELADTDGVTSRRHVLIEPVKDLAPRVNVLIEGIRKTNAGYLVTPGAMIPFAGTVADNAGLDKVEYQLTVVRLESPGVVAGQASWFAAVALQFAPGTPGSLLTAALQAGAVNQSVTAATPEPAPKTFPLKSFEEVLRDKSVKDVYRDELLTRLTREPPPGVLVPQFEVRPQYEFLDLRERLPDLKVRDDQQFQPRYRLRVTVMATDNNVETGPGVGPNKEPPFTVLVVSEPELLVEIAKEEEALHLKMEDTVARLKDARLKLDKVAEQVAGLPAEQLATMAQRAQEIVDAALKGRDVTTEVFSAYSIILKEMELNRVMPRLVEKVKTEIVTPLEGALRVEFTRAEEATEAYRKELEAGRKPEAKTTAEAQQRLDQLIERLTRIMDAMGEVTTINKLITALREIEKGQEQEVGARLNRIKSQKEKDLLDKLKGLEDLDK